MRHIATVTNRRQYTLCETYQMYIDRETLLEPWWRLPTVRIQVPGPALQDGFQPNLAKDFVSDRPVSGVLVYALHSTLGRCEATISIPRGSRVFHMF